MPSKTQQSVADLKEWAENVKVHDEQMRFLATEIALGFKELLYVGYNNRPAAEDVVGKAHYWMKHIWELQVPMVGGRKRSWKVGDDGLLLDAFKRFRCTEAADFPLPWQITNLIAAQFPDEIKESGDMPQLTAEEWKTEIRKSRCKIRRWKAISSLTRKPWYKVGVILAQYNHLPPAQAAREAARELGYIKGQTNSTSSRKPTSMLSPAATAGVGTSHFVSVGDIINNDVVAL